MDIREIAFPVIAVVIGICILTTHILEPYAIRFIGTHGLKSYKSWIRGYSPYKNYDLAARICKKKSIPKPLPLKVMSVSIWVTPTALIIWIVIIVLATFSR